MNDSANQTAGQYLNDIYELFSVDLEDETRYPGTKKEIKEAKKILDKIDALDVNDPEILERVEDFKTGQNLYLEREFVGTKWFFIVIGLWISFHVYNGVKDFSHDYTVESAQRIMNSETAFARNYIAAREGKADLDGQTKDAIKRYQKQIDKNGKLTAEEYRGQLNGRSKKRAVKNIFDQFFWIGMLAAYYFASLTPVFLIVKRRKQIELLKKGGGVLSKIIFAILGVFIAMPASETTITKYTDGSKSTDVSFYGLFFKVIGIFFVLIIVLAAMMYVLPWLVLVSYLRNYQYERVEGYFDQAIVWIKGKLGKGPKMIGGDQV